MGVLKNIHWGCSFSKSPFEAIFSTFACVQTKKPIKKTSVMVNFTFLLPRISIKEKHNHLFDWIPSAE